MSNPFDVSAQEALRNPFSVMPRVLTGAQFQIGNADSGNAFSKLLGNTTVPGRNGVVFGDGTWSLPDPVDPNTIRDHPDASQGGYNINNQLGSLLPGSVGFADVTGITPVATAGASTGPDLSSLVQTMARNKLGQSQVRPDFTDPNSFTPGATTGTNQVF